MPHEAAIFLAMYQHSVLPSYCLRVTNGSFYDCYLAELLTVTRSVHHIEVHTVSN